MKIALTGAAAAALLTVAAQADGLAMDNPVMVSGIETVCTGIADSKDDPRWAAYPVRIEFSNAKGQSITDVHLVLAKADGTALATLDCGANWVLFKLAPGKYKVTGTAAPDAGGTVSADFAPPAKGQKRVSLRFTSASVE